MAELARDLESIPETTSDSNSATVTCDEDVKVTTTRSNVAEDVDGYVEVTTAWSNVTEGVDEDMKVTTARSNETRGANEHVKVTTAPDIETQDVAIKIEAVDYEEDIDLVEDSDTEGEGYYFLITASFYIYISLLIIM